MGGDPKNIYVLICLILSVFSVSFCLITLGSSLLDLSSATLCKHLAAMQILILEICCS